jgi:hypothetical protein
MLSPIYVAQLLPTTFRCWFDLPTRLAQRPLGP